MVAGASGAQIVAAAMLMQNGLRQHAANNRSASSKSPALPYRSSGRSCTHASSIPPAHPLTPPQPKLLSVCWPVRPLWSMFCNPSPAKRAKKH